jgi:dihydrofolate synthase / folylpolyglutamate synthase
MSKPETREDAFTYLFSLPRFADAGALAYKPGLDRMLDLMDAMGTPHTAFPCIHIAGTNGKGTTASALASIFRAAGFRTGLHTSPHLFDVSERMRLDGAPADRRWLEQAIRRFRPVFDQVEPSFFEVTTALSFLYFAEMRVDMAIIETGMGGRLDATNVVVPEASVITSIGLDHTEFLGSNLAAISGEKAGIVKPGVPVIAATGSEEADEVVRRVAGERNASYHPVDREVLIHALGTDAEGLVLDLQTPKRTFARLRADVRGMHHAVNVALAIRAAEVVAPTIPESALREGLGNITRLSGFRARLEPVARNPLKVIDVAHNTEGIGAALAYMSGQIRGRLLVGIGLMKDKDATAIGAALLAHEATIFVIDLEGDRAAEGNALATMWRRQGVAVLGSGPIAAAWAALDRHANQADGILFVGSHQVIAAMAPFLSAHEGAAGPKKMS